MNLSGDVPLLLPSVASHDHLLIPLRVLLLCCFQRELVRLRLRHAVFLQHKLVQDINGGLCSRAERYDRIPLAQLALRTRHPEPLKDTLKLPLLRGNVAGVGIPYDLCQAVFQGVQGFMKVLMQRDRLFQQEVHMETVTAVHQISWRRKSAVSDLMQEIYQLIFADTIQIDAEAPQMVGIGCRSVFPSVCHR